ncbi:superoxide dismutase family protein [Paracoccus sp. Z118]|uniref:superoxide dismutase family protein n=1 Tax=Paracoccus sp. Z118 TaxID=2851017 RepID=UPI001C2BF260|nr:superoxide dismutase family protein [Paracoccus sp. Z118]MBV0892528.1 superoxide dismutase family protein [Paracoccus sp. Z118]
MTRTTAIALLMSAALPLGAAAQQQETTTTTTDSGSTVTTTAPTTSEAPAPSPAGGASSEAPAPSPAAGDATGSEGDFRQAGAPLHNAEGTEIGNVVITETASGVMHLVLDINEGALPTSQHGFHIHEHGVCEGPTFESAGGHLADGKDHGIHAANGPHPGDLPNITMGEAGMLHVEYFLPGILMDQIMDGDGAAVMIHSGVDDYTSQPAGNAGDRIACGVLELTPN